MAIEVRHHIEAVVHAVDEVDVDMAGRPEHDACPRRTPPRRVRREIVRPHVRLHLHDPPGPATGWQIVDEPEPKQVRRHLQRGPTEEGAGQTTVYLTPRPPLRRGEGETRGN